MHFPAGRLLCWNQFVWGLKTLLFDQVLASWRVHRDCRRLRISADGPGCQADAKEHLLADSQAKVMRLHFSA